MRFSGFALGLLLVAGGVATSPAAVSLDVTTLPWRRVVQIPPGPLQGRWIEVREDSVLAAGASFGFPDVRIVDEAGELVPCAVLEPRLRETRFGSREVRMIPWGPDGEGSLEAVLDLGPDRPRSLLVEPTGAGPDPDRFRYETSLDGEGWRHLGPERMDFMPVPPEPGNRFRQRLQLPDRYLKLVGEVGLSRSRLPDSLLIVSMVTHDAPRVAVSFTIHSARFRDRTWEAILDLDGAPRAVAALVLEAPRATPAALPIRVEGELPRGGWRQIRADRVPDWSVSPVDTLLLDPMRTGSLRITVENADAPNPPFTIREMEAVPARWAFPSPEAGGIWVEYGDPYLQPREWGMESRAAWAPGFVPAVLGEPEPNPLYAPPRFGLEWLKRRPAVAAGVMVVILLVAGLIVLRGARESTG